MTLRAGRASTSVLVGDVLPSDATVPSHLLLTRGQFGSQHLSITWVECRPASQQALHTHPTQERVYVIVRGHGQMLVGNEAREVSAGELVFVPPAIRHAIRNAGQELLVYVSATAPPFDATISGQTWEPRALGVTAREGMAVGGLFRWGAATYVMAIINVTPDSFSGDGIATAADPAAAAQTLARRAEAEGAHMVDVGGISTRPGAAPIEAAEERTRGHCCIWRSARSVSSTWRPERAT